VIFGCLFVLVMVHWANVTRRRWKTRRMLKRRLDRLRVCEVCGAVGCRMDTSWLGRRPRQRRDGG
jgi:hypothetical protein